MIWGLWAILELWKRVFKIRKIIFDWCVKCGIYTTNLPHCPVCAFMPKWVFFNYQHFHLKHTKLISWKKWYFDMTVLVLDSHELAHCPEKGNWMKKECRKRKKSSKEWFSPPSSYNYYQSNFLFFLE